MNEQLDIKPKVELTIQVRDKNGNIIKTIKKENDPLTRWTTGYLASLTAGCTTTGKREDGGGFSFGGFRGSYFSGNLWSCWSYKIAIGMDRTPFTYNDFKLGAKERETTSITISSFSETDSSGSCDLTSQFYIETEKTYYEFGLFGNYSGNVFLVSRDVIDAGVTVPADSYLTITYRIIVGVS
jgi:hypothetical protein